MYNSMDVCQTSTPGSTVWSKKRTADPLSPTKPGFSLHCTPPSRSHAFDVEILVLEASVADCLCVIDATVTGEDVQTSDL